MEAIKTFVTDYLVWLKLPKLNVIDVLEILIIAFAVYHIILWVKDTRAWMLVKGLIMLAIVCLIAIILEMNVLLWLFKNTISVGIIALVIIFQPELRNALEQIGRKSIVSNLSPFDDSKGKQERFSEKTTQALVRAVFEMAKVKTGALIVIEQDIKLREFERTGIAIDSEISSQLIINIFEHNTPLHDGAVIMRGDRIVSATCYLPLSDNLELSKDLGTRHRAGLGISEVSDSLTIIVSEETGIVSTTYEGKLTRRVDAGLLEDKLNTLRNKGMEGNKRRWWKGWKKDEA